MRAPMRLRDYARRVLAGVGPRPELMDALREIEDSMKRQEKALIEFDVRLRDVQAIAGRTYEHAHGWVSQLDELRRAPGYAAAWDNDEPLVTVRIATYNQARLLCERALASVLSQTYERWEAVVVGDAVTDDTERRVRSIGDPRISFVNLAVRGPYPDDERSRWQIAGTAAANEGLRRARGAWIAPLDDDDAFDDDHIEVLLQHARETRAELAYGQLSVRDAATGQVLPNIVGAWPPVYSQFGFQGALYHAALRRFEFDINARHLDEPGDWNLARRLWEAGVRFSYLPRPVTTYYYAPRDDQGKAWVAWARAQQAAHAAQP
jgi:glycosyltransferase involved in cell wall biosynthesis